ncbi:UDP-N-acetylenolpyruvoylglucosamine reductase [Neobacillus rhizosphaerae]|uniref:UDP-N-acetylenolpyruvoylglucosamine reductase n=1 Tax=Neobacillus rhizosphaerae TaxID=2880965 RepID=A0ABM9EY54_9BACI|nr:UDP-N-acetylmuramate dehydrogenase [Neobacillus rhizosphaerae]CAH2717632.1 UDP-N-acetylenolpyruvoylglucosamine reductase [Neobacillus rhizosphaerae]
MKTIYNDLSSIIKADSIKTNEPLSNYTFTKTGGNSDFVITPKTYQEVQNVYKYSLEHNIPITILGNGSNLIVKDGGIRGLVLILTEMNNIYLLDKKIKAQSGASIIDVSGFALKSSLTGLEFACGIPGSIGGALYMNAGAYGGVVSDVLQEALVLDTNGDFLTLSKDEMELDYRKSSIAQNGYLVLEATFGLTPGNFNEIKKKMDELTFQRESKQPLEYPSCGSVFKRPPGYFAGKLIQDSGLQGKQIGGAQVSTKHAGFIVNVGSASASDYLELISHIQNTVKTKFGVDLEPEVIIIGED